MSAQRMLCDADMAGDALGAGFRAYEGTELQK
jgi:hypothetical protein